MQSFNGSDRVSEHYDSNTAFANVLNAVVSGFEYPDWSHLTISEVFKRLSVTDRGRVEDALNGWSLSDKKLTARQEQFVSEHSGELRSDVIRESIARIGTEAMALVRMGEEGKARKVMLEGGLSDATTHLLMAGWKHESMEYVPNEQPAVCCIVNAVAHKTYVGRIVRMTDRVVWQEVEAGQIVEHALGAFGDSLAELKASYFQPEKMKLEPGELMNPWQQSCCISYAGGGKASVKTASLMLLDGNSVKPNAFVGRVVSETGSRFVQENENNVYAGHLKSMTGELEIGEHYSIRYRGAMGQQVAEVNGRVVVNSKSSLQEGKLLGEAGKHDWCVGDQCGSGFLAFVDDRPVSYRATAELARDLALNVIADLQADGDYRLNDRPQGFMPPKRTEAHVENTLPKEAAVDVAKTEHITTVGVGDALSIGMEIFKKLSVVVTPHDITACLTGERANSSFSGRILDVDEERGLVVQSCGRQSATVHRLGDFAEVPKVKDMMDVKYQGGLLAAVVKEVGPARGVGR